MHGVHNDASVQQLGTALSSSQTHACPGALLLHRARSSRLIARQAPKQRCNSVQGSSRFHRPLRDCCPPGACCSTAAGSRSSDDAGSLRSTLMQGQVQPHPGPAQQSNAWGCHSMHSRRTLDRRKPAHIVQSLSESSGAFASGSGSNSGGSKEEHAGRAHAAWWRPTPLLPVPWSAGTIVKVMLLWLMAFWVLGYFALPGSLELLGLERDELTARGQALVHLVLDVGELGATAAILWRCLRGYRPRRLGWFALNLRPARAWLGHLAAACAAFPLVDLAAARSQGWFPHDSDLWGPNVLEQSLAAGDTVSNAIYFVVVTVCAPLWEEAIFRGFLLPSLTKYMPVNAAVLVSALGFAGAHFSLQRFLPLVMLGIIFGGLLARTRSLAPCVLLHALWNAYIFWQLTCRGLAGA